MLEAAATANQRHGVVYSAFDSTAILTCCNVILSYSRGHSAADVALPHKKSPRHNINDARPAIPRVWQRRNRKPKLVRCTPQAGVGKVDGNGGPPKPPAPAIRGTNGEDMCVS